jgi:hypothetical protein
VTLGETISFLKRKKKQPKRLSGGTISRIIPCGKAEEY